MTFQCQVKSQLTVLMEALVHQRKSLTLPLVKQGKNFAKDNGYSNNSIEATNLETKNILI